MHNLRDGYRLLSWRLHNYSPLVDLSSCGLCTNCDEDAFMLTSIVDLFSSLLTVTAFKHKNHSGPSLNFGLPFAGLFGNG